MSFQILRRRALYRRFWRYALPSILAMVIPASYYLVDGTFVGNFVGAEGLAAINLVYPIIMVLIGLAAMISMGAATRISYLQGARQPEAAKQTLVNALWLLLILGLSGPLLILPQRETLLLAFEIEPGSLTWQHAYDYLSWISGGTLLLATNLAVPYLLRNDGRPKLAMVLTVIGGILNILFNALFIVWLELGLMGAAQATLLTELIISVLGIGYFFTRHARLRLQVRELVPRWTGIPAILMGGAPTLIADINVGLLILLHNHQLLAYGNVGDVAGYTVAGYTEAIFVVILQGLAFGIQPLVSRAAGAGNHYEQRYLIGMGLRITLIYGLGMWAFVHLFPGLLAHLFLGASDPVVIASAINSLNLNLLAMPVEGLELMGIVLLQAMNRPTPALILTITKTVLLIPLIFWLPLTRGVDGVLLAQPSTVALLALPLCWLLWREWRRLAPATTPPLHTSGSKLVPQPE